MNKGFACKLAVSNIRKNIKFYLPYVLASIGIIMMFYIMSFLTFNNGIKDLAGAQSLAVIMILGCIVLGLFSLIFIFYINGFLMKRRQKEIGLYNILGMEKRHIAKILLIENVLTSAFSIIAGLLCGALFSKLIFMILCKAMKYDTPIEFQLSFKGMAITALVFGIIFLLALLKNQMSIGLSKPIELLRGSDSGEKEPKSKGALAVIGAICLGAGYYIAITTDNPLQALLLFFVAVILVIIGTYLLFIAGSIAILKALRRNRKFYYKANHFTAVSGMLYRMKQNAVGLANICILSTMVLVMISTTVCLRVGIDDLIKESSPADINYESYIKNDQIDKAKNVELYVSDASKKNGVKIDEIKDYMTMDYTYGEDENGYFTKLPSYDYCTAFSFVTASQYKELTGKYVNLANNQVLAAGEDIPETLKIDDKTFVVRKKIDKFLPKDDLNEGYFKVYYIVVANDKVLNEIAANIEKYDEKTSKYKFNMFIYTNSPKKNIGKLCTDIDDKSFGFEDYHIISTREETESEYYGFSGGFLFLGLFLGTVFTFAAALIIYYKQISEGYYDKDKFEIMQKVGMSKAEVRKSIKTQVLMVFFAPLAMAAVHILAAFNLIKELLKMFALNNVGLFATCTVVTFVVFAIIYSIVYGVTAREYYKIVEE